MKKILFALFFLNLSNNILAQKIKKYPISVGVQYSIDNNYRTLKQVEAIPSLIAGYDPVGTRNQDEQSTIRNNYGINVCIGLNKFFALQTGLGIAYKGYKTRVLEAYFASSGPGPIFTPPSYISYDYLYKYVTIPIIAKYFIGKKKLNYSITAGFAPNFLNKKIITQKERKSNGSTEVKKNESAEKIEKTDITAIIGVGVNYDINNKISISLEPTYRPSLTRLVKNAPISEKLTNYGLAFSVNYKLQ